MDRTWMLAQLVQKHGRMGGRGVTCFANDQYGYTFRWWDWNEDEPTATLDVTDEWIDPVYHDHPTLEAICRDIAERLDWAVRRYRMSIGPRL